MRQEGYTGLSQVIWGFLLLVDLAVEKFEVKGKLSAVQLKD